MPLNPPVFDLALLTPQYIKDNYLIGLVLTGADKLPLPDPVYQNAMDLAAAKVSDLTSVDILLTTRTAEKHDFRLNDYANFAFMELYRAPVDEVSEIRAVFPTGSTVQVFPSQWIRVEKAHGQIHLVPTIGSLSEVVIGHGMDWFPLVFGGMAYLPQLWEVDYKSGFKGGLVPRIIVDAICKMTLVDLLTIMSDTVGPIGVQSHSVSVDGLSQSRSYALPAFKGRIDRYREELYGGPEGVGALMRQIKQSYHGLTFASV